MGVGRRFCRCGKEAREKPGAGRGLGRNQVCRRARGVREPSPAWSKAPRPPHRPPPHTVGHSEKLRRAAAGAAETCVCARVFACVRARARQVRTPMFLPPPSWTPPDSASSLFSRLQIRHHWRVHACVCASSTATGPFPFVPLLRPSLLRAFQLPFPPGSLWGQEGEICV